MDHSEIYSLAVAAAGLEIIDVDGVADMLGCNPQTVMGYARTGELRGTQIGHGWIFIKADVFLFLRSKIDLETEERKRVVGKLVDARNAAPPVTLPPPGRSKQNPYVPPLDDDETPYPPRQRSRTRLKSI